MSQKITEKEVAQSLLDSAYVLITQLEADITGQEVESLRRIPLSVLLKKCGGNGDGEVDPEIVKQIVDEYLAENPPSGVTDQEIADAIEKYLTENPVEGVTDQQVYDAVAEYLTENPVESVTDEEIAAAVANYLEENPVEAGATAEEAAQIQQNKEGIEQLSQDKLDASKLPEAVNAALTQAKESGEFKGEKGDPGKTPEKGKDYFTDADKQEIAEQAAQLVDVPEGLTTEQITALDNMFKVCAFSREDVSAEYAAFQAAFGISDSGGGEDEPDTPVEPDDPVIPEVTLARISVVYDGGDVAVGTALAELTGIVVTVHYSDGTSETVTGYTLSGEIAEGENTITVSYQDKTATFIVTGVAESGGDEPEVTTEVLSKFQWRESGWPKRTDNGDGSSTMDWTGGGKTMYDEVPGDGSKAYWTMVHPGKISGGRLDIKFHKTITSGSISVCVYAVNADATLGYYATTSDFVWTESFASANAKSVSVDTSVQMPDGLYPYILVRNGNLIMDGDVDSSNVQTANHIANGDITFEVTS